MRGLVVWRQSFTRTPWRGSYWTPTALGTQPLEGLRQFATNGSTADNGKPGRTLSQTEHRFVGQVAGLSQSRNRRGHGPGAGCDNRPFEPQRLSSYFNGVRATEMSLAQE